MPSLYDRASMQAALSLPLDAELHALLASRIAHLTASKSYDLTELTHLVVIQAGDTNDDLLREIGFSPLVNAIGGTSFGAKGLFPSWDWLQHHGGWFEMIVTVGDSGFAYVLFIQDAEGVDPNLRSLCHAYTTGPN